ncbi:hypothetical protein DPMN_159049 [Dreissena polymorpha]|uniref:Uncharacterized protein n=1 Tax=Dreissena polymorpha TaxID=45954 RepID=A0A9D4EKA9_DREPO|nr:hypothetical protein DPMN_159049 [Dreissena polymorpha]
MTEWVRLKQLKCPAPGCPSTKLVDWVCAKDKNNTYLNENGEIKCAKSENGDSVHLDDLCKWGWKCGDGFHEGQHIRADFQSFTHAMSTALTFSDSRSALWISKLILALGRQYRR